MFIRTILHILFPEQCVGCRSYDELLCASCARDALDVEYIPAPSPLSGILTIGEYHHDVWKSAVKQLKFSHRRDMASVLGELLAGAVAQELLPTLSEMPILIPIPLHAKRFRERGYNQTELIAKQIAEITGWEMRADLLQRKSHTAAQSGKEHHERTQNIANAFNMDEARAAAAIGMSPILLIDDVLTTGSTILEAAKTMKTVLPKTAIYSVAVARGE